MVISPIQVQLKSPLKSHRLAVFYRFKIALEIRTCLILYIYAVSLPIVGKYRFS